MGNYMQSKIGRSDAKDAPDVKQSEKTRRLMSTSIELRHTKQKSQNGNVASPSSTDWEASGGEINEGQAPRPTNVTNHNPTTDEADKTQKFYVFAAIDIGTTYSGFAFAMYPEPGKIPDVYTQTRWQSGSNGLMSLKCPTSVLYGPGFKFHSFGFDAEDKYVDLVINGGHKDWFLFRRFKMILYETDKPPNKITIKDICEETEIPAIKVFADAIKFMKEQFLESLKEQFPGQQEKEVKYVITVPAIWNDKAKEFMKLAAEEAGIDEERIDIALEPEAASVWCQSTREFREDQKKDKLVDLSVVGSSYVVVDLGGGTADITCHRKRADGKLEELHRASGNDMGGDVVNTAFFGLLDDIFTTDIMDEIRKSHIEDYISLAMAFESKKRAPIKMDKMIITLPASIRKVAESRGKQLEELVKAVHEGRIGVTSDKLKIPKDIAEDLFKESILTIGDHMDSLFKKPDLIEINTIMLVGGYSECGLIKRGLRERFPEKCLLVPDGGSLAVLKGAVLFGHNPDIIYSRRSRYAYGREALPEFNAEEHDESRATTVRGKRVCKGVFRELVKLGESIPKGTKKTYKSKPISPDSEYAHVNLYSSINPEIKYIDDEGCQELGRIVANLPKGNSIDDKGFEIQFEFGETTIKVNVCILKTGETYRTQLKF